MENNYTEWSRRNPGRNFEDYKQAVGFPENQLPPELPQKKKKSLKARPLKEKILIVIITALSAAVGGWIGDAAIHAIRNNQTTDAAILEQDWVKNRYENYGLTIETPWPLNTMPLTPEQSNEIDQLKELIESMDIHESDDNMPFKVVLNMTKYSPGIEFNLQGAAEGTINGMKNQPDVTNFIHDKQPYRLGTIPGFIQKGSFDIQGEKLEFTSIGLSKEGTYFQLIISTKSNDKTAKKAAERIINSIEID